MAYKILIVDDSKLARMAVAKLLNGLKPAWQRLEASSADEAIDITRRELPDIILLDFNMPGRSGLELAEELREQHPGIPVALISANIQFEVITRAKEAGTTFLAKPLNQGDLAAFLADAETRLAGA